MLKGSLIALMFSTLAPSPAERGSSSNTPTGQKALGAFQAARGEGSSPPGLAPRATLVGTNTASGCPGGWGYTSFTSALESLIPAGRMGREPAVTPREMCISSTQPERAVCRVTTIYSRVACLTLRTRELVLFSFDPYNSPMMQMHTQASP